MLALEGRTEGCIIIPGFFFVVITVVVSSFFIPGTGDVA